MLSDALLELSKLIPPARLLQSLAARITYSSDNSKRSAVPAVVILAEHINEVQQVVRVAGRHGLPVTARGRATSTTGASVPTQNGIVLSLERMRGVLEINPADRYARVQAGVLNGDLQQQLAPHGLMWAPDPTSAPYSTVGGNLACNAGGPRTVKYGACRDNVLGLSFVDGTGALIHTGAFTSKSSAGLDLTRLLVGSEGLLGIIVEATLKLLPKSNVARSLLAFYSQVADAAAAVARVMCLPTTPSALEFMDGSALRLLSQHQQLELPNCAAMLLLDLDGPQSALDESEALTRAALAGAGCLSIERAANDVERAKLWSARRALSPTLRLHAPNKINEDVVVPVSRLAELSAGVEQIAAKSGLEIVCFGHAGNGNVHVNILYDGELEAQRVHAATALDEVFALVLKHNGTLSGEHGIGIDKRPYMQAALGAPTIDLMRRLKQCFDPQGILNPGKVLP
jgi:D-lactate dehydrogenase